MTFPEEMIIDSSINCEVDGSLITAITCEKGSGNFIFARLDTLVSSPIQSPTLIYFNITNMKNPYSLKLAKM